MNQYRVSCSDSDHSVSDVLLERVVVLNVRHDGISEDASRRLYVSNEHAVEAVSGNGQGEVAQRFRVTPF